MRGSITLAVALGVVVASFGTTTISGQSTDPRIGRWQLNLAKSKFTGPPPKAVTRVYEDRGGGIVLSTITTTPPSGAANVLFVLYKIDGKEYPQLPRGAETTNTVTQRLIDAHTVDGVTKKDGKVVGGFTQVVSADGKTLTYTPKDDKGQPSGVVQVFDKQGGST
jgi:hypothetical protein